MRSFSSTSGSVAYRSVHLCKYTLPLHRCPRSFYCRWDLNSSYKETVVLVGSNGSSWNLYRAINDFFLKGWTGKLCDCGCMRIKYACSVRVCVCVCVPVYRRRSLDLCGVTLRERLQRKSAGPSATSGKRCPKIPGWENNVYIYS